MFWGVSTKRNDIEGGKSYGPELMKLKERKGKRPIISAIQTITGFYNPLLIVGTWVIFLIVLFLPIKVLPDYFHVGEIENLRTFTWSLFSATLGFSGLILTLLLLSYNFYLHSTRRHTVEFIFENPYLRFLFSGFFAIASTQLLAFLVLNKESNADIVAAGYFLFIMTGSYILLQLPLALLGLQYSTSIRKLDKVVQRITLAEIQQIVQVGQDPDSFFIDDLEGNSLIVIKDIGLSAIKGSDWVLPQKILGDVLDLITNKIDGDRQGLDDYIAANLWINSHFHRAALKNSDQITMGVIMGNVVSLYYRLVKARIFQSQLYQWLDDFVKELMISLIQAKDFSDIRESWLRNYIDIMISCACSLEYDDEALPTLYYGYENPVIGIKYPHEADYYLFWHYLINTQFDTVANILEIAFSQKDERVFRHYNWTISRLVTAVTDKSKLTKSQQREFLSKLLFEIGKLRSMALGFGITDNLEVISEYDIQKWAKNKWFDLYRSGLYGQFEGIKGMVKASANYGHALDHYFMSGRMIAQNEEIDLLVRIEIVGTILGTGLRLYQHCGDSQRLKYDIQHQLQWLFYQYVVPNEQLSPLLEEYGKQIEIATEGFNFSKMPDF